MYPYRLQTMLSFSRAKNKKHKNCASYIKAEDLDQNTSKLNFSNCINLENLDRGQKHDRKQSAYPIAFFHY